MRWLCLLLGLLAAYGCATAPKFIFRTATSVGQVNIAAMDELSTAQWQSVSNMVLTAISNGITDSPAIREYGTQGAYLGQHYATNVNFLTTGDAPTVVAMLDGDGVSATNEYDVITNIISSRNLQMFLDHTRPWTNTTLVKDYDTPMINFRITTYHVESVRADNGI